MRRPSRGRVCVPGLMWAGAFGLLVALTLVAGTAFAQQIRLARVTEVSGYTELGLRAEKDRRDRNSKGSALRSSELRLDQLLHLDLDGYLYHPRFVRFHGSGELHFFQTPVSGGSSVLRSVDRELASGSWILTFLEEHPYGLNVFGNVSDQDVDASFTPTFLLHNELFGATFHFRRGPLPFQVTYDQRSRAGTGPTSVIDEVGTDFSVRSDYRIGESSQGGLEYRRSVDDIRQQDQIIDRSSFSVDNVTYLDPERRRRLRGNLRFFQQVDVSRLTRLSALGGLDWRHSKRLTSRLNLDLEQTRIAGQRTTNWNLEAGARHQLYESLASDLAIYARLQDATFGSDNSFGGTLSEQYTKRLGGWGRVNLSLIPFGQLEQIRSSQDTAQVVDEGQVLQDAVPAVLKQPDVLPGSIVVTDAAGLIVFQESLDYAVQIRGSQTEILRLAGGAIANLDTVLVDYEHRLPSAQDVLLSGVNGQLRVSLPLGIALFGTLLDQNQRKLSGDLTSKLESRNRLSSGIELNRTWMSARVEAERETSTFASFRALSQTLSLFTESGSAWRGRVSGTHRQLRYTDSDQRISRTLAAATLRRQFLTSGRLELAIDYERTRWSGGVNPEFNDVDGLGVKASLEWSFRRITVTVTGNLKRLERLQQRERQNRILLRVRRDF
ncbi:MAG: hypothetical protein ACE5IL_01800 [Myxococcota bacterium]